MSEYRSVSIEMPMAFLEWWRTKVEPTLAKGVTPFNSNAKDTNLRVKLDPSTQFFNSSKEIYFPELKEGVLDGATVQCVIEITGTYFFQGSHGLIVRAHQVVVTATSSTPEPSSFVESEGEGLKGFAFTLPDGSGCDATGTRPG